MENRFHRVTIVGGGSSISEGEKMGLWDRIDGEIVIATNYSYRYVKNPTINMFVDNSFFRDNIENIKRMPLVITKASLKNIIESCYKYDLKNIVYLPESFDEYHGESSFVDGVYSAKLVGLFSLTTAIQIGFKEIYLLGFDFGAIDDSKKTHFYEGEIRHRGVGFKKGVDKKTGEQVEVYSTQLYSFPSTRYFNVYRRELKNTNIYNVSPKSNIDVFEKITYNEYFRRIENKDVSGKIDQEKIRIEILKTILEKIKSVEEKREMDMAIRMSKIDTQMDPLIEKTFRLFSDFGG